MLLEPRGLYLLQRTVEAGGRRTELRADPPLAQLPVPLRVGEAWSGTLQGDGVSVRLSYRVVRLEEIVLGGGQRVQTAALETEASFEGAAYPATSKGLLWRELRSGLEARSEDSTTVGGETSRSVRLLISTTPQPCRR